MSDYCLRPDFYSESFPTARKQHRCVECSAPIQVGEKHLAYSAKWDGDIGYGRQHMHCREICMLWRDKFNESECLYFGELNECFGEIKSNMRRNGPPEEKQMRSLMAIYIKREKREKFSLERTQEWHERKVKKMIAKTEVRVEVTV